MEKHIAVVHVGAPDEERNTRKFLINLAFRNVTQLNTVEFTCLLNNITEDVEQVQKHELYEAIDKYLKLDDEKQLEILQKCCTFVIKEDEEKTFKFELPQQKYYFEDIEDKVDYIKEIVILESKLKYCKNHMEKQQITREIQNLKWKNGKHQNNKTKCKKRK